MTAVRSVTRHNDLNDLDNDENLTIQRFCQRRTKSLIGLGDKTRIPRIRWTTNGISFVGLACPSTVLSSVQTIGANGSRILTIPRCGDIDTIRNQGIVLRGCYGNNRSGHFDGNHIVRKRISDDDLLHIVNHVWRWQIICKDDFSS